ncbi:Fructose dehydrogenase large subunit [Andreprevotia sp. IGB-42]|uniref:GMC family oxidoreductase n=1 Tax=Andreprevotia sp. IGB-42 TaxID=2497473 RepID=UPI0013584999|nr:GMC family oxidoreductase [Andreprevotia sp. IGB-42]KAF0813370.1 Fructose dehydrogenase large subunit [Andreprevotia sp. IGB-42]
MANTESADIVVVGSGVAGALIAHQLASSGASVLLLEAGPRLERWRIVENYRNTPFKDDYSSPYPPAVHAPHPQYAPPNDYLILKGTHKYNSQYLRVVGGTTWHWAAATWRFLPVDFRMQSTYGVGRDWPLAYQDLESFYAKAEIELGVSGPNDGTDLGSPRSRPYPMDALPLSWNDQRFQEVLGGNGFRVVSEPVARNSRPYDTRPTCCGNNNCMPICPIGAMYGGIVHVEKAERAGARVLANAVVYKVELDAKDHVAAVHYKDPAGVSHRVSGRQFVLAANGIEIPKLLLMSTDKYSAGVANRSDQVGRNLMDHPGTGVTFLANEDLWPGRGPMEMTSIVNLRDGDFRSGYAGKKLHLNNGARVRQATETALGMGLVGPALDAEIRRRAARTVNINSFHDILPNPYNRIVPSSSQRDALGLARPEITYSIDDYVQKSAVHTHEAYAQIAQLFGGTEIYFDDEFAPNNHIMGTTIMGSDGNNSVVNADCRTHDHDNLWIASGAVMASAGTVNCTLTIAALALRIADALQKEAA